MVKRRTDKERDEEGRDAPDSTDPSDDDAAIDETSSDTPEMKKKTRKKKRAASAKGEGSGRKRRRVESEDVEASKGRDDDEPDEPAEEEASEDAAESDDGESTDLDVAARDMTEAGGDGDGDDEEDEDEDDEDLVLEAHQLGIQKYVLAAYFASGMLGAYIFGRFLHSVWVYVAIRDWFSQALPDLAAIPDDTKLTYATVFSGVVALFTVIRCYKSDRIRGWVNDVAGELAKVKWPTKKETTNSTITVLATTAVAMTYLALLDRLWGFVTNLVYGAGT